MNKTPSQPRSQQASRGLPHTLRLEQCPQTKPLIHRGGSDGNLEEDLWAAQPLKGQLGFLGEDCMKIYVSVSWVTTTALGVFWTDTLPPYLFLKSILPRHHSC